MSTKLASLIILVFALFAVFITIRVFKKNRLSTRLFLMWLFVWGAIGFFSIFPSALDRIMLVVNLGNRTFFLTSGAILILYMIIFYLSSNISSMNGKISRLVQEIAILKHQIEAQKDKKEKKND